MHVGQILGTTWSSENKNPRSLEVAQIKSQVGDRKDNKWVRPCLLFMYKVCSLTLGTALYFFEYHQYNLGLPTQLLWMGVVLCHAWLTGQIQHRLHSL